MRLKVIAPLTLVAAMSASVLVGCAEHHYYRAYDPYYQDYHPWNSSESVYYQQWARHNHYDPDRDYRRIPPNEQRQYWQWRHNHGKDHRDRDDHHRDRDHDHDNDRY